MAGTPQDYRNIGNDCVTITEMLSRQVYDPEIHLRDGEQGPPVDKTKIRIERYIEDALLGPANANPRKLVKTASESNAAPPQCAGAQGSPLTL
ncbi:hypothetical protein ACRB68_74020 [Actinomadura sp. RB68]|uniref:Uncharacterized protein n=2 Tax=Actinomadura macrotermitis TaxID=2585200 RepID=A0A7K0C770_9ACTN|nr:hypothetical protein [Actinomadura macrotermitis]